MHSSRSSLKSGSNFFIARLARTSNLEQFVSPMKPINTLYVSNLNDKINKTKLRESLYLLFSQYGTVIEVMARKTKKMRGQAYICYTSIQDAMTGMEHLRDKIIFGKAMKIEYAKINSTQLEIFHGNYIQPEQEQEDLDMEMEDIGFTSSTLYVKNLPSETSDDMLSLLFQQYEGFIQVRLVPGNTDVAFIDYQSAEHAKTAKLVLDGFLITKNKPMQIEFAKN
eukprot:NODE_61_length_25240_cov_0.547194.p12 type:complete len:224 gc:universal NODE_61_length_25240_cov_0.547194:12887-13558(+)